MKIGRVLVGGLLAILLVAAGYMYLPYLGWSDSRAEAEGRVKAYLAAVVGGSEDRGWNLLEPSGRGEFGSEDAYRTLMAQADWSRFEWELRSYAACDDGICSFILLLPNGEGSAPAVAWSDGPGDPGFLISLEDRPDLGDGLIDVRQRGWFGGIGVVVSGVSDGNR